MPTALSQLTWFLFLQAQNKIKLFYQKGEKGREELGVMLSDTGRYVTRGLSTLPFIQKPWSDQVPSTAEYWVQSHG